MIEMDISSKTSHEVEHLIDALNGLALERQNLRSHGASHAALERNRTEIVRRQWELSHALLNRYLTPQATSLAA
jgi:hypothetical protein